MNSYPYPGVTLKVNSDKNLTFLLQPPPQQHQTLIIEEFEPDVFRQLIEYIHTGCVTLQPRTLLGKKILNLSTSFPMEFLYF